MDGPGVGDTRLESEEAVKLVTRNVQQALATNTQGYHAFLLVLRFGARFTQEEQDTLNFLKALFGESFTRDFCIVVMTCGDMFEIESEENGNGETFDEWCERQEASFQDLLKECSNRVLLFDSVTKDERKRNAQIDSLLAMVNGLKARGERYTNENFKLAKSARLDAISKSKEPLVKEEILQETTLILQKLEIVRDTSNFEEKIDDLHGILEQCDELIREIERGGSTKDIKLIRLKESLSLVHTWTTEALGLYTEIAVERRRKGKAQAAIDEQFEERVRQAKKSLREQIQKLDPIYIELKKSNLSFFEKIVWSVVLVFTAPIALLSQKARHMVKSIFRALF